MAMTFTSDFNMELNRPIDTKYVCDSLEELLARLGSYLYVGLLTYCKSDNKYYSLKEINGNNFVWEELKGSGSGGGIGIPVVTQSMYEEYEVKPDEYIAIDNFHNGVVENNTYITSGNGTYIDILFSAIRSLLSEVARLKNSFYYGIQSYNGTDTASASMILNEEQEEQEPLWAIDPEDLIEFDGYSVGIGTDCELSPIQNIAVKTNYIEIYNYVSLNIDLNFDISQEAKQCVYIIADVKLNSEITLNLSGDSNFTLHLHNYLNRNKCNILVVINRKVYNEDTEQYTGKNYIWVQVTDLNGNVVLTGYVNNTVLQNLEIDCGNRFYVDSVSFTNINLYKCNFYGKQSGFTNDDVLSSLTPNDNFTYKAAHITIRSVSNKDTLLKIKDRLLENELVLVESEKLLYIKNNYLLISLSSGAVTDDNNGGTMTSEQILSILKEAGYITSTDKVDASTLSAIEKLTFTHTESGQSYNMSINSDGKLIIDQYEPTKPDDWILKNGDNIAFTGRGAASLYVLGNKFTSIDNNVIYGYSHDPKAYGDRIRFGSWYIPTADQGENDNDYGCSHDFIELANSGSVDYPLEGARLYIIKGDIKTLKENVGGEDQTNSYLLKSDKYELIHKFILTGSIKAGSTYLIRGEKHEGKNKIINVDSYDYELRNNDTSLFSLKGTVGMVLLNAANSQDIGFEEQVGDDFKIDSKPIQYLNSSLYITKSNETFLTNVRSDLLDCIPLGKADAFRVKSSDKYGTSKALGAAAYDLKKNHIVKDFFELDPSRQGFLSLTTNLYESTNYRLTKVNAEYLNLAGRNISFPHSDEEAEINRFTPKASYENKNICTDKTPLNITKPNMVSCFPGINMQTTRCFAWVSAQDLNEYVWIRKKGDVDWNRFESYKGDSSEISSSNDSYDLNSMNRIKYTSTVIDSVYKRMKGIFPGSNYSYVGHKCIVYIQSAIPENSDPVTYEYLVGVTLNNGRPNLDKCSNIQTFTLYPKNWTPKVYLMSDQQGFEWTEYLVWAAAAKLMLKQINEECNATTKKFPVLLNSGDCTQNGTRYNEWLDYYNAGYCLFDHLEQMNVVGNNDLANAYDHSVLGTGNDEGKSNPYYFHLVNCYELDSSDNYNDVTSEYNKMWKHPLIFNGVYFPSTYYTYFDDFAYLMLNSELTVDMCKGLFKAIDSNTTGTYNLYTGYLENTDFNFENVKYSFKNTIKSMLEEIQNKKVIAVCHEMPFTVITNENLTVSDKSDSYMIDRSCNGTGKGTITHSSLVGSHMNRLSYGTMWDRDDVYWFSLLLQKYKVRLCLGGHKHSYTCTYPVYENPTVLSNLLSSNDTFKFYHPSKLFITVVDDDKLKGTRIDIGDVTLYKTSSGGNGVYPLLRASKGTKIGSDTLGNCSVTYFMVLATGYKLKSNKELPSANQTFSMIRPDTKISSAGKATADASQESPMFATVDFVSNTGNGYWGISLYRIINIKQTAVDKVTEFSSIKYSTLPMISEKLILNYVPNADSNCAGNNKNYWYTNVEYNDGKNYGFNYKTENKSDRCWGLSGNKVSIYGGSQIDYTNYTLTVDL